MEITDLYKAEAVARAEALVKELKEVAFGLEDVKGILTNFISSLDGALGGPGIFGDEDILDIAAGYLARRGKDARWANMMLKTSFEVHEQE
jgi:hypothetical protein